MFIEFDTASGAIPRSSLPTAGAPPSQYPTRRCATASSVSPISCARTSAQSPAGKPTSALPRPLASLVPPPPFRVANLRKKDSRVPRRQHRCGLAAPLFMISSGRAPFAPRRRSAASRPRTCGRQRHTVSRTLRTLRCCLLLELSRSAAHSFRHFATNARAAPPVPRFKEGARAPNLPLIGKVER
jgi:hypothetical protein